MITSTYIIVIYFNYYFYFLGGKLSLSPGKDGDKMSPYSGLQLYQQHQPQFHRDEHSENMDLCKHNIMSINMLER